MKTSSSHGVDQQLPTLRSTFFNVTLIKSSHFCWEMGLAVRLSGVRVLDSNTKMFGTNINTACRLVPPAKINKWTGELSGFTSNSEAAAPMLYASSSLRFRLCDLCS